MGATTVSVDITSLPQSTTMPQDTVLKIGSIYRGGGSNFTLVMQNFWKLLEKWQLPIDTQVSYRYFVQTQ